MPRPIPNIRKDWLPESSSKSRHADDYALLAAYAGGVAFIVGILAPCFTMIPKLGGETFEGIVRLFVTDDLDPKSFSLLAGIGHLFHEREWFIGGILLLFSIVFPAAKTVAVVYLLHQDAATAKRRLKLLELTGKWSMLDVFVLAALVVVFKGFPGGSKVVLEWGIYAFAASVILGMISVWLFKSHLASETKSE